MATTGILVNLATVYEEQGQLGKAEATYQQAISQWREASRPAEQTLAFSHMARAQYNLARLLLNQGVRSRAETAVRAAMAYDKKSEGMLDLCRTVQLYDMIEMELAGRRADAAAEEEMAGICAALKQMAHRGSLFEMKEAARVAYRLEADLQLLRKWREIRSSLQSKPLEELCSWVQENLMAEFPPFPLLKEAVSLLLQKIPAGKQRVELAGVVYDVTPAEFRNWLLFVQVAALTKECLFSEVFSLIEKYPNFLSLRSCFPPLTPLSLLHSLQTTLQTRSQFPSTASPSNLDTPYSKSSFLLFKSKLSELLPPTAEDEERTEFPRQHVLRGDSRFSAISKRSNHDYEEGGSFIPSFQPRKRRRLRHVVEEDLIQTAKPTEPRHEEGRKESPETGPISSSIPEPSSMPSSMPSSIPSSIPSQQDAHEMEIRVCAVLAGNEQEYKEFLPLEQARNRDYLNTMLCSRIRRDFVDVFPLSHS